jgi:hypothetical protein
VSRVKTESPRNRLEQKKTSAARERRQALLS